MNKPIIALSFIILILSGFMFSYLLKVTGKVIQSNVLMIFYYTSLAYILMQFTKKPTMRDDE